VRVHQDKPPNREILNLTKIGRFSKTDEIITDNLESNESTVAEGIDYGNIQFKKYIF